MKQSAVEIVKRWMSLDKELLQFDLDVGLNLTEFAETWGVDQKTIRRDLEAFRELGFESYLCLFPREPWMKQKPGACYRWQYRDKVKRPMFSATWVAYRR